MTAYNQSISSDTTGWAQKNFNSYIQSFVLCLVLTILSFGLAIYSPFSKTIICILLAIFAVAQMLVQAICFLGLKFDSKGRWNTLPFLFTILIIFFLVGGSLWIMYNLSILMMDNVNLIK